MICLAVCRNSYRGKKNGNQRLISLNIQELSQCFGTDQRHSNGGLSVGKGYGQKTSHNGDWREGEPNVHFEG